MKLIRFLSIVIYILFIISCHSENGHRHETDEHRHTEDHDHNLSEESDHDHQHENVHENEHEHPENDDHENSNTHNELSAITLKATETFFSPILSTSGEMLAMPGEKQNISASSHGIILFASKNLVQGSKVKKGQLLFSISGKNIAENNIDVLLSDTRSKYQQSKSEFLRHQKLYKDRIVSEKQFNETKTKYLQDSAAFYAIVNNNSENSINIYAPLSGYVHELNVSEGQHVETGQLIATVSTNKIILLRADVPQQQYQNISKISDAHFRPSYSDKTYTVSKLGGNLLAKGSSVAENNHYIPVYFEVPNDGSLLEGAYAEFNLILNNPHAIINIPLTAILEEQGKHYVYIKDEHNDFEKRYIQLGENDGIRTEVLSGLEKGEEYVSEDAMSIKASLMTSSIPQHNHSH